MASHVGKLVNISLWFTWALLRQFSVAPPGLSLVVTTGHQHSSLRGQLRRRRQSCHSLSHKHDLILTHTHTHVHKHTWWRSSSCFRCSSANLFSQDTFSQANLVLSDRISDSALVSLLLRAVFRSGLPGMAAIPLLSKPDKQSQKGVTCTSICSLYVWPRICGSPLHAARARSKFTAGCR